MRRISHKCDRVVKVLSQPIEPRLRLTQLDQGASVMSKIEWERDLVERPFCRQLQAMGWD